MDLSNINNKIYDKEIILGVSDLEILVFRVGLDNKCPAWGDGRTSDQVQTHVDTGTEVPHRHNWNFQIITFETETETSVGQILIF